MYIKKKDQELFAKLDKNLETPKYWSKFIHDCIKNNRLIIKLLDHKMVCTSCKSIFEIDVKINEFCTCPKCGKEYLVKSNRLKHFKFESDLAILQKFENYYIVRAFRAVSFYKNYKFSDNIFEYGRIIYDNNFNQIHQIINDNVVGTISGWWISYRSNKNFKWRYFRSYAYYLPDEFWYYPYNLKELLSNNKEFKYSMLWELVKHVPCNLIYLMNNYNASIEILTKMGLYKLALCPKTFDNKKSFSERFMGLTKEYLPFIRTHNLDLDELIILSKIKVQNYELIKRLTGLSINNLDFINNKVNILSLLNKTDFDSDKFYEYRDYLEMAEKLKLNLKDKSILYPKSINSAHDKVLTQYKEFKNKAINNAIKKRYQKLKKYIYNDKNFIIIPAKDYNSLIDESNQQNNCVRTYAEYIANGDSDIYFMRYKKSQDKSLVTVEVRNKKIVQKRTKNNGETTNTQNQFLKIWENKILNLKEGKCIGE